MSLKLVIANKCYSSWSMRPWLVMRAFGVPFDELVVPLRTPQTKELISRLSPSGKVPVLIDGDALVWESLAIIEYLAEKFPQVAIWPRDLFARAQARSIANEMHGGFLPLRQALPMNLAKRFRTPQLSEDAQANVARVEQLWRDTASEFGGRGEFLLGEFSAADAMYAPVVTRLDTYQIPVARDTRRYMDAVLHHPAVKAWTAQALAEPWVIPDYEVGHEAVEDLRVPT